ncbi:MAG: hypothetical protein Sapg2KO_34670 [Saprospiraceae bacterium]
MIQQVLSIIAQQLNNNLQRRFSLDDGIVALGNLCTTNTPNEQLENNKIILTLINVQQEQIKANLSPRGSFSKRRPTLNLNLSVLLTAHFQDYNTSLKLLSSTLIFFQDSPLFTSQNTPELNNYAERVSLEIVNMNPLELSSLWSMLGTTYKPSVIYKFSILGINEPPIVSSIDRKVSVTQENLNP